ncbi:MAG: peroxiredoxin [Clostridiaceae bacterium]|nr:peroxiredoxin [Clostridiaceae bacterium]
MTETSLIEGTKAPDFTLPGSDKNSHYLSDYKWKKVILYFYPKDNTSGCSIEAEAFRDNNQVLQLKNTIILGVSRDSLTSHVKFIDKLNLPFVLLADTDEIVCNLYQVIKEKSMYGRKFIGIERSTFLIDEQGILLKIFRKVKIKGHIDSILNLI